MTDEEKKALQDLQAGATFTITCRCIDCGVSMTGDPLMEGWEHLQYTGPENDPGHQSTGWYCHGCQRWWKPERTRDDDDAEL